MQVVKKPNNKSSVPCDCCDELLIEYIDAFGSNIARLRQDIREIISDEVDKKFSALLRELRRPQPYIERERGYRY
jgi:hypothetical protein